MLDARAAHLEVVVHPGVRILHGEGESLDVGMRGGEPRARAVVFGDQKADLVDLADGHLVRLGLPGNSPAVHEGIDMCRNLIARTDLATDEALIEEGSGDQRERRIDRYVELQPIFDLAPLEES